jgi:hypothetical protein
MSQVQSEPPSIREVELIFSEAAVDPWPSQIPEEDLGDFLSLFKACYQSIDPDRGIVISKTDPRDDDRRYPTRYNQTVETGVSYRKAYLLLLPDIKVSETPLTLTAISKESPLKLTFSGLAVYLSIVVSISGGDLEAGLGRVSVHLPPLAQAVYNLRQAFNAATSRPEEQYPIFMDEKTSGLRGKPRYPY